MKCKICEADFAGDETNTLCPSCRKKLQSAGAGTSTLFRGTAAAKPVATAQAKPGREVWRVGADDPSHLKWPLAVALLPSGELAVLDQPDEYRVLRFSLSGKFLGVLLSVPTGSDEGQLEDPQALCVDGAGAVYVVDAGADRIAIWNKGGQFQGNLGGSGRGPGEFARPGDVQLDEGALHVADAFNHRLQKLSTDGFCLHEIRDAGQWGALKNPRSLAIDAQQRLYVADEDRGVVLRFGVDATPQSCWPDPASKAVLFERPCWVRVDRDGSVFVADRAYRRVQRLNDEGVVVGVLEVTGELAQGFEGGTCAVCDGKVVLPDRMNDRLVCLTIAETPS